MIEEIINRYSAEPLLFLLEMYVLKSIGCLTAEREFLAKSLVQSVWGAGDWQSLLRETLGLKKEIDEYLTMRWKKKQELAQSLSVVITPDAFAIQIVEASFSKLIASE